MGDDAEAKAEAEDEKRKKRKMNVDLRAISPECNHVLLSTRDNPFRPHEYDMSAIRSCVFEGECMLAKKIRNEPPSWTTDQKPYWRSDMRQEQLDCFYESLKA